LFNILPNSSTTVFKFGCVYDYTLLFLSRWRFCYKRVHRLFLGKNFANTKSNFERLWFASIVRFFAFIRLNSLFNDLMFIIYKNYDIIWEKNSSLILRRTRCIVLVIIKQCINIRYINMQRTRTSGRNSNQTVRGLSNEFTQRRVFIWLFKQFVKYRGDHGTILRFGQITI